jgi:hypothetical protein
MTTLRCYVDHDELRTIGPTSFMTERNGHQVRCGICGRTIYVDGPTFRAGIDALRRGLESPFRCEVCTTEDSYFESER